MTTPDKAVYRTIVADPPWEYPEGFALGTGHLERGDRGGVEVRPLPYPSMTVDEIAALPVRECADQGCRLFLWTTNRYIRDAFDILDWWGFRYRQTLVWHKTDVNLPGAIAPNSAEFILVGSKGFPARGTPWPSAVISLPRQGNAPHSTKPECFLDYIESVSEPPRLEMFARRQRLGWDTWGDQALEHVEIANAR